jgi:hypothetical protein
MHRNPKIEIKGASRKRAATLFIKPSGGYKKEKACAGRFLHNEFSGAKE